MLCSACLGRSFSSACCARNGVMNRGNGSFDLARGLKKVECAALERGHQGEPQVGEPGFKRGPRQ